MSIPAGEPQPPAITTQVVKRIVIDPVTRVEGHGKVTVVLDEDGRVRRARLHIVEFRGFERFIQGRFYWEVPVIVQRLCGICPVSHHLTAAKAMDHIVGVDRLTPVAEKMRRLMHYGQMLQSHSVHFFHLASPDLVMGMDADPSVRNVAGVLGRNRELAHRGIMMRKYGQEIIDATAGKRIHGTGAVPGGINKNLPIADRDRFRPAIDEIVRWSHETVAFIAEYTMAHLRDLMPLGTFESNSLSLVGPKGALEWYDGNLRAIDTAGGTLFDNVSPADYLDHILEEVRPWTYMKFPFFRSLGPERGWYRVGALARMNTCTCIDTPLAHQARSELFENAGGPPNHMGMLYHWARIIEVLHAAEKIRQLLDDPDLQDTHLVTRGHRRREAVAALEAPRGTLFHHYQVNNQDLVTRANLIVSTTQNNEPMNRAVEQVARNVIDGKGRIDEPDLNRIEAAIRAYDPCLSCATHAVGKMPLVVEVCDADGAVLQRRGRGDCGLRTDGS
ncbi:MAG: Ni/Fe hydrogenase subunit alpha [Chitinivibrionales bacterium]|nr:Ni/Fe hydrogenase subunit alpha [Chitinivibrionales bacterium]